MSSFLDSIKAYIDFGETDASTLRSFLPMAEPHLPRFVQRFYARIAEHPEAYAIFDGPEQIERLKRALEAWMRSGLSGPHDHEFYVRRARIGRVHVRVGLPHQFMFTAMNLIRRDFHHLVSECFAEDPDRRQRTDDALDRLFDMELAIMLQTYQEDTDTRLRRHERLATLGQIAASIGHDLRNPLGVMQSSLYILRKRAGDDDRMARHLAKIDTQIRNCEDIVSNLLDLARSTPPRRTHIDVPKLFAEAIEASGLPSHIEVQTEIAPALDCQADHVLLRQALINLLTNAAQAYCGKPGRVMVSAIAADHATIIEVADDGPGFDPETISRVFEPLITTRTNGIGLGLALVKGVTERHGGTVEASNRPGGGALVRMHVPRADEEEIRNDAQ